MIIKVVASCLASYCITYAVPTFVTINKVYGSFQFLLVGQGQLCLTTPTLGYITELSF